MKIIRPYHFSKIRPSGFLSFYNKVKKSGGILCLDFEDSIADPDHGLTARLKHVQRIAVAELLKSLNLNHEQDRIGIRINSSGSGYFWEDLDVINSLEGLHTVFLPKVEGPGEITEFLDNLKVNVKEIIPIIETDKAFDCIEEILFLSEPRFAAIVFGHCDFNLSKNYFPFFHQDSKKYWEWISFLDRKCVMAGKNLINSPVLRLDDEKLFKWVLGKITEYPSMVGQTTMSLKQTEWCSQTDSALPERLGRWKKARIPNFDASVSTIENFKKSRLEGKSFAVDKNGTLISPQEYSSAQKYLEKFCDRKNILIVGGCLPIQHNIPPDRLYHSTVVQLLKERKFDANIAIIRYETLSNCLEKIVAVAENIHIDILMFNLRTEPLMRISKVFYKYADDKGNFKRSLNLPSPKLLNAEKHDPLMVRLLDSSFNPRKSESKWRRFLIESNCYFGVLIGNRRFALKKYEELLLQVNKFCAENGNKFLILGPATRPFSRFEDQLAEKINKKFSELARKNDIPYVDVMGTQDDSGNYLFCENGIHVSQAGHDRIGKMIFEKMVEEVL